MGNSIRRPRGRPRVGSVNFRSFAWVLIREAVIRLEPADGRHLLSGSYLRELYAAQSTGHVRKRGERLIAHFPQRRFYP